MEKTTLTLCAQPPGATRLPRGFTLIELMVTVAVVGILSAIALPSYTQYVQKGRRVDAKNAVQDLALREERFFSTNNHYSKSATDLGFTVFPVDVNASGTSYYSLDVSMPDSADSFKVTATPKDSQTADACYAYNIDNLGVQTNTDAANAPITTQSCW
jgi:type IV pilus assembly protein PilE